MHPQNESLPLFALPSSSYFSFPYRPLLVSLFLSSLFSHFLISPSSIPFSLTCPFSLFFIFCFYIFFLSSFLLLLSPSPSFHIPPILFPPHLFLPFLHSFSIYPFPSSPYLLPPLPYLSLSLPSFLPFSPLSPHPFPLFPLPPLRQHFHRHRYSPLTPFPLPLSF